MQIKETDYIIVTSKSVFELINKVKTAQSTGWLCLGAPYMNELFICQAMVRRMFHG